LSDNNTAVLKLSPTNADDCHELGELALTGPNIVTGERVQGANQAAYDVVLHFSHDAGARFKYELTLTYGTDKFPGNATNDGVVYRATWAALPEPAYPSGIPTHSACQTLCPACATNPDGNNPDPDGNGHQPASCTNCSSVEHKCWEKSDPACNCFMSLDFCAGDAKPMPVEGKTCPSCWPSENTACACAAALHFCNGDKDADKKGNKSHTPLLIVAIAVVLLALVAGVSTHPLSSRMAALAGFGRPAGSRGLASTGKAYRERALPRDLTGDACPAACLCSLSGDCDPQAECGKRPKGLSIG
jgi:hypothetical protein